MAKELKKLDAIEKNFLQVNVLIADKHYTQISEHPTHTWDTIPCEYGWSLQSVDWHLLYNPY